MDKNVFVTGFFGWNRFKWFITELVKMYSAQSSFFSKKRIESGIAYIVLIHGFLITLITMVKTMQDFAIWVGLLMPIIVYTVQKIQKEKIDNAGGT